MVSREVFIFCDWDEHRFVLMLYQICPSVCLAVCLSDTLVICEHTFQPIETILVSMESPKILVSEKVSLVQIGHS